MGVREITFTLRASRETAMTKKKIVLVSLILVAAVLVGGLLLMSRGRFVELQRADINMYIEGLSHSDVYKLPYEGELFFVVWRGKNQEGYVINFEKRVIYFPIKPMAKVLDRGGLSVRGGTLAGLNTETVLVVSFEEVDDKLIVEVQDVAERSGFTQKPLIFGKKLEFIFD